ncbi:metalloregulator ArsR/SmtB family transcription factor [Clostridiaceae bacterium M8S5]|nr:metalloregulator ArsR/SmtB family transcription factor [Clostridiaceae bacterium M8S5]
MKDIDIEMMEKKAEILKAIGHPIRLCIIKGLLEHSGCNVSFMQNCLKAPQSTISQHIAKLKAAGILKGERNGVEIRYKVVDEDVKRIIEILF